MADAVDGSLLEHETGREEKQANVVSGSCWWEDVKDCVALQGSVFGQ